MAIIKKSDLKKMKADELDKKLVELRQELMKANAQITSGTVPENPGRVREMKKTIARLLQKKYTNEVLEVRSKQ